MNRVGEGTSIKYRELSIRDGYDNFKTETLLLQRKTLVKFRFVALDTIALYLWFGVYKGLNGWASNQPLFDFLAQLVEHLTFNERVRGFESPRSHKNICKKVVILFFYVTGIAYIYIVIVAKAINDLWNVGLKSDVGIGRRYCFSLDGAPP